MVGLTGRMPRWMNMGQKGRMDGGECVCLGGSVSGGMDGQMDDGWNAHRLGESVALSTPLSVCSP